MMQVDENKIAKKQNKNNNSMNDSSQAQNLIIDHQRFLWMPALTNSAF